MKVQELIDTLMTIENKSSEVVLTRGKYNNKEKRDVKGIHYCRNVIVSELPEEVWISDELGTSERFIRLMGFHPDVPKQAQRENAERVRVERMRGDRQ